MRRWWDIRTIRWEVVGYEDQKVGRWWDVRTRRMGKVVGYEDQKGGEGVEI